MATGFSANLRTSTALKARKHIAVLKTAFDRIFVVTLGEEMGETQTH